MKGRTKTPSFIPEQLSITQCHFQGLPRRRVALRCQEVIARGLVDANRQQRRPLSLHWPVPGALVQAMHTAILQLPRVWGASMSALHCRQRMVCG